MQGIDYLRLPQLSMPRPQGLGRREETKLPYAVLEALQASNLVAFNLYDEAVCTGCEKRLPVPVFPV